MVPEKYRYLIVIIFYLLTVNLFSLDISFFQNNNIIKFIYNSYILNLIAIYSLILLKVFLFEIKLISNNIHIIYVTVVSYLLYFLIFESQNIDKNYYFFSFIFLLDVFIFNETYLKMKFTKKYTKHLLYIFTLAVFINPNFFYIVLFSITIFILLNLDIFNEDVGRLKYLPIVFILIKPLSFLNGYLNTLWISTVPDWYRTPTRYLDTYQPFYHIYCNNKEVCDYKTAYTFLEYFFMDINPELLTEIFASIIIFIISILIFKFVTKNGLSFLQLIVLLSPIMNFAIQRMNFDNLVLISISFLLFKSRFIKFLGLIILLIPSMIKMYPLVIFFGMIIYLKSKYKSLYILLFIPFSFILVYDFFTQTRVSSLHKSGLNNTFGIISDFNSINLFFGNSILFFLISFSSLILFIKLRDQFEQVEFSNNENFVSIILLLYIFLGLFSNWDYRIILFFPLFFISGINQYSKIFLFYFIVFSATGYLEPVYNSLNYFNIIYLIKSIISIFSFNIFLLYAIEKQLITLKKRFIKKIL